MTLITARYIRTDRKPLMIDGIEWTEYMVTPSQRAIFTPDGMLGVRLRHGMTERSKRPWRVLRWSAALSAPVPSGIYYASETDACRAAVRAAYTNAQPKEGRS